MEYKSMQELYLAVGVAGTIVVVFLGLFTYLVINNDKKRTEQLASLVDKVANLQTNDRLFENLMQEMTEAVKELSITNRNVSETVNKLDFYNKDLHRKADKMIVNIEEIRREI